MGQKSLLNVWNAEIYLAKYINFKYEFHNDFGRRNTLKKLLLSILLLSIFITCIGCEDNSPQFRNLDGYTLVYIRQDYGNTYGYLKNEELELYTKDEIDKIKVLYPYKGIKEEQFVIVNTSSIRSVTINELKYFN